MFCLFGYDPLTRKDQLKKTMATSFISDAIFVSLKTQFEDAMRTLVHQIATGEGLDASELESKYLVNLMGSKPPVAKRAAKVTVTDASSSCSCTTAKGKPCALKPLVGTTMCRLHTKKADTAAAGPSSSAPPPGAVKEKKKTKASKKKSRETPPMHTHELDEHNHEDCELCQTHGNPLESIDETEEFERVRSPKRTLRDRLSRVTVDEPFLTEDDD